jgi:hypothetical protein
MSVMQIVIMRLLLILLFFSFLLDEPSGPAYARTLSLEFYGIVALGLVNPILGIIAGAKDLRAKPRGRVLPIIAASFGAVASLPFFLLALPEVGLFVFLTGTFPAILYLLLTRNQHKT